MTSSPLRFNHIDDLPHIFGALTIVGEAQIEKEKYILRHKAEGLSASVGTEPKTTNVSPNKPPQLYTNKEVKAAYQNNNWAKIKEIEDKAQKGLQPVMENIKNLGERAWAKVKSSKGDEFYMSWTQDALIWSFTESMVAATEAAKAENPNTAFQSTIQVGQYVKGVSILGVHSYNLDTPHILGYSVAAYLVARVLSSTIADGLGFLVVNFAIRLTQVAVELGLESFSFVVSPGLLASLASTLVFVIVFITVMYIFNWLNRLFTLKVQVFNWDKDNDWKLFKHSKDNAVNPGRANDFGALDYTIDKMGTSNSTILPPDFNPITTLDSICYYGVLIYQNEQTFMEGCDIAIQTICGNNPTEGFTIGVSVPWGSSNKIAIQNASLDPGYFLKHAHWTSEPKTLSIDYHGKTITTTIDYLVSAPDDLYNVNVHIGKNE
ncbi:hypothetical protein CYY_002356 [Polysphondylium violaceum]|uniref:Uncharacterized protein n=1 Tax=Polysphondylium violaceum TaxID=133409 RepID=A0A8J4V0W3_9MYCE|nr:hypothetical protein CYY_002356 [Polysphondylium violaceum]